MVGETRDKETAMMAIEASLTGHFVLSTLHTNDAASAPNRLIDMGVQPFLIASSLAAILAQRLIQTLCEDCKVPYHITPEELEILQVEELPEGADTYKAGPGCAKCNNRGYAGRTTVCELLTITDEVKPLILQKSDAGSVKKLAMKQGMRTLRQSAVDKIFSGLTSVDEVIRAIQEEEEEEEKK
jgi:general secretion pathway protein E